MTDEVEVYEPDAAALDKASLVLNAFRDAGLKPPYDFDSGSPERLWAAALMPYELEPVQAAMGQWVFTQTEFPSIAEFTTLVDYTVKELADEIRSVETTTCSECLGVHWVTEWGAPVEVETFASKQLHTKKFTQPDDGDPENRHYLPTYPSRHSRPCSTCPEMRDAYELYQSGHFRDGHVCPVCIDFHRPYRGNRRRTR